MFKLELKKLKELDAKLYHEAISLKGEVAQDLSYEGSESDKLAKMFELLRTEGAFRFIRWIDRNDGLYTDYVKGILGSPAYPDKKDNKNLFSESTYILVENGSLISLADNKIIDISEIKGYVQNMYDLVERGITTDYGQYNEPYQCYEFCGECRFESAKKYFIGREKTDDPLINYLKFTANGGLEPSESDRQDEYLAHQISVIENELSEFEQHLIRQNSGFNPDIDSQLKNYRIKLREIFSLEARRSLHKKL